MNKNNTPTSKNSNKKSLTQGGKRKIYHPHDSLFKVAFRGKEVMSDFLKNRLEKKLLSKLDLRTLKLENSSFIKEELKSSQSDLVFSVSMRERKGYVYLLIEHQTKEDKDMMLRLIEYNSQLMREHWQKNNGPIPTIINLVLYTGKKPYNGPKSLMDAIENPELFLESLKRNVVIELSKEDDSKTLKDKKAALVNIALKWAKYRDFCKMIEEADFDIGVLINESSYGPSTILYMLSVDKNDNEELFKKLRNLAPESKKKVMSALQRIVQKSEQRGQLRGIRIGEERGQLKGIRIGERRGEQRGKQKAIEKMVTQGYITPKVAKQMMQDLQD